MKLASALALLSLPFVVWAQGQPDKILNQEVPARPNEICIGCNRPIAAGDKVYLVEGQRVPVHRDHCDDALRASPIEFLASLKPRGGLFGGETAPPGQVTNFWLFLGFYVLVGLAFSAVCAHRALNAGRSPIPWFFAGLLFNAFGYLTLLTRPKTAASVAPEYAGIRKIPSTAEPQPCPGCGATNHPSAARCLECGAELKPAQVSEAVRIRITPN